MPWILLHVGRDPLHLLNVPAVRVHIGVRTDVSDKSHRGSLVTPSVAAALSVKRPLYEGVVADES